jgi:hypothetical protein
MQCTWTKHQIADLVSQHDGAADNSLHAGGSRRNSTDHGTGKNTAHKVKTFVFPLKFRAGVKNARENTISDPRGGAVAHRPEV